MLPPSLALICRSTVGRRALTARAVVRLEGVVGRAVGPVAVQTPFNMRIVAAIDAGRRCDVARLLIGDRAADNGAGYERCCREPEVAVSAVAGAVFAGAAMTAPIDVTAATLKPVVMPVVTVLNLRYIRCLIDNRRANWHRHGRGRHRHGYCHRGRTQGRHYLQHAISSLAFRGGNVRVP